jgi:hypothetical protein
MNIMIVPFIIFLDLWSRDINNLKQQFNAKWNPKVNVVPAINERKGLKY